MKTYLFEYRFDGAEWALDVAASSEDDARARVLAMAKATFCGELIQTIPATGPHLITTEH